MEIPFPLSKLWWAARIVSARQEQTPLSANSSRQTSGVLAGLRRAYINTAMDIEFHYYRTYLIAARAGFAPQSETAAEDGLSGEIPAVKINKTPPPPPQP